MKKLLMVSVLVGMVASLQGAPEGQSKEQFLANKRKEAETKGQNFDAAKSAELFGKIDANADGILTPKESKTYWANWEKAQKGEKPKKAPKPAAKPGGSTKEQFMAYHQGQVQKKGASWNPAQFEKMFSEIDANADGFASDEEKKAYWDKKK